MFRIGVVVEGACDLAALPILIKKCRNDASVIPRECRGPIFYKFPRILDELERSRTIDKALVICDADGEQPSSNRVQKPRPGGEKEERLGR